LACAQNVTLWAANNIGETGGNNCAFPEKWIQFEISPDEYSLLWGNAFAEPMYILKNNSLVFNCSSFNCGPAEGYYANIADFISLDADTACTMTFILQFFERDFCYTEWICGAGFVPSATVGPEFFAKKSDELRKAVTF